METKHTPQLPDLESAPTNDTAALTCYALDWRELSHEFKAERDHLRQINAQLVAALERIVKSLTLAGEPELACRQYELDTVRAALTAAKGE